MTLLSMRHLWPPPRPRPHSSLASLTSLLECHFHAPLHISHPILVSGRRPYCILTTLCLSRCLRTPYKSHGEWAIVRRNFIPFRMLILTDRDFTTLLSGGGGVTFRLRGGVDAYLSVAEASLSLDLCDNLQFTEVDLDPLVDILRDLWFGTPRTSVLLSTNPAVSRQHSTQLN